MLVEPPHSVHAVFLLCPSHRRSADLGALTAQSGSPNVQLTFALFPCIPRPANPQAWC